MEIVLPQNFEVADATQVLNQARPMLKLPPDAELRVENVTQTRRSTRIDFSYTTSVALDDDALNQLGEICVQISAHGDLKFDARGYLVAHEVKPTDPRQLRAIRAHVNNLIAKRRIYIAQPGEKVDLEKLRAQGKDWYIAQDEHGAKHLCRAWMS